MPELGGAPAPPPSDVLSAAVSFADLLLPADLVRALNKAGFSRPSPVQQAAIPLGRFGADLIVQAKSGTGKTVTFGAIVADSARADSPSPRVLILEPTREVALQTHRIVASLCAELPSKAKCLACVGGLSVEADGARLRLGCQVVVGTPGRLRALLELGHLRIDGLRVLVIDEADTLLTGGFASDLAFLFGCAPVRKQVLAFSATYTPSLLEQLRELMLHPQEVMLCPQTVALHKVQQLYVMLRGEGGRAGPAVLQDKEAALVSVLKCLPFNQALVFCNNRGWMEALAERLTALGFPAAFTCGTLPQHRRMAIVDLARKFKLRILLSTDLNARGLDLPSVSLIVNLDLPLGDATYMHRVGRTGRFGTQGAAVSVVTRSELGRLKGIVSRTNSEQLRALPLPAPSPSRYQPAGGEQPPPDASTSRDAALAAGEGEGASELECPRTSDAGTRDELQAAYSHWWWRLAAWRHRGVPWYASGGEDDAPWPAFPALPLDY